MSKKSKRGNDEKESLKLLKMKNSALLYIVNLCFTGILTTSCFRCLCVILAPRYWQFHVYCLQNDDVIEFALLCQFFFLFFTIIKMGIINEMISVYHISA